jgi:hypothetical protein
MRTCRNHSIANAACFSDSIRVFGQTLRALPVAWMCLLDAIAPTGLRLKAYQPVRAGRDRLASPRWDQSRRLSQQG